MTVNRLAHYDYMKRLVHSHSSTLGTHDKSVDLEAVATKQIMFNISYLYPIAKVTGVQVALRRQ